MTTLHVLSHSPFSDSRFDSCLRLLGAHDGLLLSGDAVYALQPGTAALAALEQRQLRLYALAEDLEARGLQATAQVAALDYPAFVQLTLDYDKVNSWL
ncbi:sulfurtransferase complex subunit TusB [Pseudomonas sp. HR96]|uniref:sulfurtransferase complex subunit TusB n=1 Tax=Pseudomonas sp. HR96 TaxID=1027966 RepID=UPI002A7643E4|nr:sulfurtransferase complex subunit TusB [Pseudomonas sp. HR96]WPO98118.1 sulfurtransferase complex subunit TusB [Pseudomonas sp. HR96]